MVVDAVWTFGRRDDRVRLRREPADGGLRLVVEESGVPRSYFFTDAERLVAFQSDMEAFLVRTGWSLIEFSPDRRNGGDRRGFPRIDERRRWWTDGTTKTDLILAAKNRKRRS